MLVKIHTPDYVGATFFEKGLFEDAYSCSVVFAGYVIERWSNMRRAEVARRIRAFRQDGRFSVEIGKTG